MAGISPGRCGLLETISSPLSALIFANNFRGEKDIENFVEAPTVATSCCFGNILRLPSADPLQLCQISHV